MYRGVCHEHLMMFGGKGCTAIVAIKIFLIIRALVSSKRELTESKIYTFAFFISGTECNNL